VLVVKPKERYGEWLAAREKLLVRTVCLTYLPLYAIAIDGIMEETFRDGDEHLRTVRLSEYHPQRICLQTLTLSRLKKTFDEQMTA